MKTCPACGKEVRPVWPTCRSCGTLLMAAPAPAVPVGASPHASAAPAPSAEEQFFAPAVMQPALYVAPPASSTAYASDGRRGSVSGAGAGDTGKWIVLVGMVGFMVAAIAIAWFTIRPSAEAKHETPVVLAPRPPTAGLPTDLGVIVRVEAESARHTALQAVEQVGSGDVAALANRQPNYQWVAGDRASTDSHFVSVAQNANAVTIAVAASNHDVCAFGQWSPTSGTAQYVTMSHESTCAAVNAPSAGWSAEPGGAASDLPDDNVG